MNVVISYIIDVAEVKTRKRGGIVTITQKQLNNANSNLKTYQHEVAILRQAKDTFEQEFDAGNNDIKRALATELDRIGEELRRHINHHKNENARIQQQLAHLSEEKVNYQNFLRNIREQLEEIERQVGE